MQNIVKNLESKNPSNLVSSILFLLIGIILFSDPNGIVSFISYILGIIIIIIGVVKIISSNKVIETHDTQITLGILLTIIGIILIFCGPVIELMLRFFMGAWILISGVNKLVVALNLKDATNIWIKLLIVSILLIIIGLYVILKSNLVFSSIGLIMIIFSCISIIGYIITPKPKNENIIK